MKDLFLLNWECNNLKVIKMLIKLFNIQDETDFNIKNSE